MGIKIKLHFNSIFHKHFANLCMCKTHTNTHTTLILSGESQLMHMYSSPKNAHEFSQQLLIQMTMSSSMDKYAMLDLYLEHYTEMKKKELLIHTATWMNLTNVERMQSSKKFGYGACAFRMGKNSFFLVS